MTLRNPKPLLKSIRQNTAPPKQPSTMFFVMSDLSEDESRLPQSKQPRLLILKNKPAPDSALIIRCQQSPPSRKHHL
ncbi:hypothetical protein DL89DRAFT_269935 [Linderina pennispora]|uniref:Uncharacterized protein n=1 Tax=Linderina pennispora TaxID=61395 RepID=A0A1Y1W061_9FUNG|nr:uncharacterized protein DL89DRAFT_269935 [Linderina pennispora]ORX66901.1 hypothetical protein DL89DRAFT_269935 [Linderina pennispora]